MKRLFVSYSRANKANVDELVRRLSRLGYQAWVDSALHGGQLWWDEVLREIAGCDAFIAIVSRDSLNSLACRRELEWALALGKPVLPVAVEPLTEALPRDISTRQIVDYSEPGVDAPYALLGALAALPATPAPPEISPEPPAAPLSYLTDLVEQVTQATPLTHEQQRQILTQLQPALRSADPEELRGAQQVLDRFSRRDDLYADVNSVLTQTLRASQSMEVAPPQVLADRHRPWTKPTPVQVAALLVGLIFLLMGLLSFVPGVTTLALRYYDPPVAVAVAARFVFGIVGIAMAWTPITSKRYLIIGGTAFMLMAFVGPWDPPGGRVDMLLNVLGGLAMVLLGWLLARITRAGSTAPRGGGRSPSG